MEPAPATVDCDACEAAIGYAFSNRSLLVSALTHASGAAHRLASNERLEFLGDSILGEVVCWQLFQRFPNALEGELTRLKSIVVSRDTCARITERIGLEGFLLLGKGMTTNPRIPKSVKAAVFESLVAAIRLDGGLQAAQDFVERMVIPEIESAAAGEVGGNFKSMLQQIAQREHGVTPLYRIIDQRGPDHSKHFSVAAEIGRHQFTSAWGRSKKEAEQRAAENAIAESQGLAPPHTSAVFSEVADSDHPLSS